MAKVQRNSAAHMTSTVRLHAVHETDQNARIMLACVQNRTAHNRTVEHLLAHRSDEPLQKNTTAGVTGLYGFWTAWRAEEPGLQEIHGLVARGAIAGAADQVAKWEATNHEHAGLVVEAAANGKPIPRRVQNRNPDPKQLYRRRKTEERTGSHRCWIDEKVRRIDKRTIRIPGIGTVRTKDDVPENLDIRSCVVVERTPEAKLGRKLEPSERSFRIHVSGRLPKRGLKSPDSAGDACGLDHGIVHTMTTADDRGNVQTFDHDIEQAVRANRQIRNNQKRMSSCRTGSRRWKRRRLLNQRQRGKLARQRRHRRRAWANHLTHRYDTLCVEKLKTRNMTRSGRGTSETPGTNVRQKTGLNRGLLGVAPTEQTAILIRAGERHGTRIELVPAHGTSQRCNACGFTHRKNRESQALFRCRRCGYTDNADANAARNIRDRGVASIRARMNASREDGYHLPEGTDAGLKTERQEQSRRLEKPAPPERAPAKARSRFHHSHEKPEDTGILAARQNTGILA